VISTSWIEEWIEFLKKEGPAPSIIDNRRLEIDLVTLDNKANLEKDKDFFMINKQLWDFLMAIYGGGPTIVINEEFRIGTDSEEVKLIENEQEESQGSFEL